MRLKDEQGKSYYKSVDQLARTPSLVGFKAGWTSFTLTTVHILYGKSKAEDPERVKEIEHIANFLARRAKDSGAWSKNSILLGDFNIFNPKDATFGALTDAGFVIPEELQELPSNVNRDKFYDQIAFRVWEDRFSTTGKAGVFNFFETVFKEEEEAIYGPEIGMRYLKTGKGEDRTERGKTRYYKMWRTHQLSDHLPMWVEIKIDYSDTYLADKLSSSEFQEIEDQSDFSRSLFSISHKLDPDEKDGASLVYNQGIASFETFKGSDYVAQDYREAEMATQDLSGKDFTQAVFDGANLVEVIFEEAVIKGASFEEAQLGSADFSYADAQGAKFVLANLQKALFIETDLRGADFSGADVRDATFFECLLEGASFQGALISLSFKKELEDQGIDLSGADFFF